MTDLEATRLCAEAMRIHGVHEWEGKIYGRRPYYMLGLPSLYEPLHDDAQMAALVKAFPVECFPAMRDCADASLAGTAFNLNKAVVYCVATMQAAKEGCND